MTIDELRDACGDGTGSIIVVLNRVPTGEKIRLTTGGGPLGEILCVNSQRKTVARFEASAVLKFLNRAEAEDAAQ